MISLKKAIAQYKIIGRMGYIPKDSELVYYINLAFRDIAKRATPLELTTSNDEIQENLPLLYLDDKNFIKTPDEVKVEDLSNGEIELDGQLFDAFVFGIAHFINPDNKELKSRYYYFCDVYKQELFNARYTKP